MLLIHCPVLLLQRMLPWLWFHHHGPKPFWDQAEMSCGGWGQAASPEANTLENLSTISPTTFKSNFHSHQIKSENNVTEMKMQCCNWKCFQNLRVAQLNKKNTQTTNTACFFPRTCQKRTTTENFRQLVRLHLQVQNWNCFCLVFHSALNKKKTPAAQGSLYPILPWLNCTGFVSHFIQASFFLFHFPVF